MPELDRYGPYLVAAFVVTVAVLVVYGWYLWSRLRGARQRSAALAQDYSARNVSAAPPIVTTAQPASSANGPSTS